MEVFKFGGSSVGTGKMMLEVAGIVERAVEEGTRVALVVSAMAGVTDSLADICNMLGSRNVVHGPQDSDGGSTDTGPDPMELVETLITDLATRHKHALVDAGVGPRETEVVTGRLEKLLDRLEGILTGAVRVEELSPRTTDLALSFGERLSSLVLAGILRDRSIRATAFEAETAGIRLLHTWIPEPDYEGTARGLRSSIVPMMKEGGVPVISGYYGVNGDGIPRVLGRGGSDLSGAIVARALEAARLIIWTDVDGFMSADPAMVAGASLIPYMSYREAAELAYFGAGVLHPRTIEAVQPVSIPVLVRNTRAPLSEGTLITAKPVARRDSEGISMEAVAVKNDLAVIKMGGSGLAYQPNFASQVFGLLGELGSNMYAISTSLASFSVLVDHAAADGLMNALSSIRAPGVDEITSYGNVALICVVGDGIEERVGIAASIFLAVAKEGINIRMISEGASDVALNFIVDSVDRGRAAAIIHERFIAGPRKSNIIQGR